MIAYVAQQHGKSMAILYTHVHAEYSMPVGIPAAQDACVAETYVAHLDQLNICVRCPQFMITVHLQFELRSAFPEQ